MGEVSLTTRTGPQLPVDHLGVGLAEHVDLAGGVHRDHLRFETDDARVVHPVHRQELNSGVLIKELVEIVGAEGERGDHLAGTGVLTSTGDDAGAEQFDNAVGKQLGVHAEVAMI